MGAADMRTGVASSEPSIQPVLTHPTRLAARLRQLPLAIVATIAAFFAIAPRLIADAAARLR